ncbi:TPA: DUF1294 domain-containing protein [Neisseria meningitidis]|uniref:DUF1294 domain-containing protein n=1 Tax=Neisseria meningitidis TaxID=487 RepID=UPI0006800730|nr:DUF1294 domain-containing protein [Neisseria meningitidis]MCL4977869.1 DUF1294 domain-containing protein [Neisseria meningitidis]MCL4998459.1 DUF1294 domain-containing protein [Neisseria meningitidis]MCL5763458.1 DUF1294 domain-containing protein [Neisseria meningitidis]MCL5864151.1 DUF1294 domain-containing protein [Neisseria meningitidis]MCL5916165.1 DUF1294 domain-containing protein [Neisseria meningitidis]
MKRQAFFKLMACAAFLSAVSLRLPVLGACYAILSLYTFALYGIDKRRAIRGQRRIPEHRLLLPALFGGWTGAYLGSRIFRHKTAKKRFAFMLFLTVTGNILATFILIYYFVPPEFFVKLGQNT